MDLAVTHWPLSLQSPNSEQVMGVWDCQCVPSLVTLGPSMPVLGLAKLVFQTWGVCLNSQMELAVTPWPLTLESPNMDQVMRVLWCQRVPSLVTLEPSMPVLGLAKLIFQTWGLCLNLLLPKEYRCNYLTIHPRVTKLGPGHQSVVMSKCAILITLGHSMPVLGHA